MTPAERRGALVVVLLVLLGAAHDLMRARRIESRHMAASPRRDSSALVEPAADSATGRDTSAPRAAEKPLDLNRATVTELDALPGIGPVLASRIVEHRRRHGPFRHVEELAAVRGIGPRAIERLRSRVTVGSR